MSAFPSSASDGDEFTIGTRTFVYNAASGVWKVTRAAANRTIVQSSGGAQVVSSTDQFELQPSTGKLVYSQADSALFVFDGAEYADPVSGTTINPGAWSVNVNDITYDNKSFNVGTYQFCAEWNNDGTKFYVTGYNTDAVKEYTMSTAYDVSTASLTNTFSVNSNSPDPVDVRFSPDGTKMFLMQFNSSGVDAYDLSTPFDTTTAVYSATSGQLPGTDNGSNIRGIFIGNQGQNLYIHASSDVVVRQYSMSVPYDVTTISYDTAYGTFSSGINRDGYNIYLNPQGTKMYLLGDSPEELKEYTLSTPFDVSTAVYESRGFVIPELHQYAAPTGFGFSKDGKKLLVVDQNAGLVYQYSTGA